ncbi:MAG TPA: hypothetical protein VFR86_05395 [Burkholderiaceae bacterium]|nr:hypothetical protein [Burkholderiaceae bacterium]
MNERDRLYLGHIVEAIAAIESFTTEGRDAFLADLKTQSAVVRQLHWPVAQWWHRHTSPRAQGHKRGA